MTHASRRLVERLRARAHGCCEYCRSQERVAGEVFTVDHVVPRAKSGSDDLDNLALCCYVCNPLKGDKTEALDPKSRTAVPLFSPRAQRWADHFKWSDDGLLVVGTTPAGRATVEALKLNRTSLVLARETWVQWGVHPPEHE